mgnify:FL=1
MFAENTEPNDWKIEYVRLVILKGTWVAGVEFEIIPPRRPSVFIRFIFSMCFINDYFHVVGREDSVKVAKEKEALLKNFGLARIREYIDADSIKEGEFEITEKDLEWADKIKEGQLQPSSIATDPNIFSYFPKRKMGF